MAQWKNREEYEEWKADRLKQANSSPSKMESIEESADNSDTNNKSRKLTIIELFGLIFLCLIILVAIFGSNEDATKAKTYRPGEVDAFVVSQEIIKRYLKAPSTAKFASYSGSVVTLKGNLFYVTSYVDAQNSFGAMLRNRYVWWGYYNKNTKTWNTDRLKIADILYIKNGQLSLQ